MNSPHIDSLVEQIQNSRTKEYFKEVLSSFYSGNYRSAIVMLYTCVICDLVYKLTEMKEHYNDKTSEDILETINRKQEQNPKSPEWEKVLIEEMYKKHRIIEIPEYTNIESLQHHRNLCAHPILKDGAELYCPNGFTVQAHIINMLEGVLSKSSMISTKLFENFIEDISKVKDILIIDTEFSNYITSKYLNKINNLEIEYTFFKALWKFVFKLDNEDCENNRHINYKALKIILNRHKSEFIKRIDSDKVYFGQCVNLDNTCGIEYLIYLMNEVPKIYKSLPNENKVALTAYVDTQIELKQIALFNLPDVKKHVFNIGSATHKVVQYLHSYLLNSYSVETARQFNIYQFSNSHNFNCADFRFEKYINPYIDSFTLEELKMIIKGINSNSQIYLRNQAKPTNAIIVNKIKELEPEFELVLYPNVHI